MQLLTRKFTVEQYHKMAEVGILTEEDRVELIKGEIVEMSPIGLKHAATVNRLNQLFYRKLGDRVLISVQNPIQLTNNSEPQPDLSLLKPRADFYETKTPEANDIFLIVEVADTTIIYDRDIKIPLYAENGISEVWLIDVNNQSLTIYRQPTPQGYQAIQTLDGNQNLSLLAFPEITINFSEILNIST
nr:Uma2 family endonuclease [Hydrococcus rivularis]